MTLDELAIDELNKVKCYDDAVNKASQVYEGLVVRVYSDDERSPFPLTNDELISIWYSITSSLITVIAMSHMHLTK